MKRLFLAVAVFAVLLSISACSTKPNVNIQDIEETAEISTNTKEEAEESVAIEFEAGDKQTLDTEDANKEDTIRKSDRVLRIGSLKGPTTIGICNMMEKSENGGLPFNAEFTMAVTADEITAKLVNGDLDIALIPANLASVLYNKTEGMISVININTMGVLYGITGDDSVKSLSDLRGRTIYMTGKGSTPEFVFQYLLRENDMENDVSIEYKNEAAEIAAIFENDPKSVAILPQPFATVVMKKNEGVAEFMNLNDEWDKIDSEKSEDSKLVTGVTVISKRAVAEYEEEGIDIVNLYNEEHKLSAALTAEDSDHTAELIVNKGIIEKEPIAKAALPKCNISFIEGEEMKNALLGYLSVLFEANPKSIGGKMPKNDFFL